MALDKNFRLSIQFLDCIKLLWTSANLILLHFLSEFILEIKRNWGWVISTVGVKTHTDSVQFLSLILLHWDFLRYLHLLSARDHHLSASYHGLSASYHGLSTWYHLHALSTSNHFSGLLTRYHLHSLSTCNHFHGLSASHLFSRCDNLLDIWVSISSCFKLTTFHSYLTILNISELLVHIFEICDSISLLCHWALGNDLAISNDNVFGVEL
jgi:hypothetical protein